MHEGTVKWVSIDARVVLDSCAETQKLDMGAGGGRIVGATVVLDSCAETR